MNISQGHTRHMRQMRIAPVFHRHILNGGEFALM